MEKSARDSPEEASPMIIHLVPLGALIWDIYKLKLNLLLKRVFITVRGLLIV